MENGQFGVRIDEILRTLLVVAFSGNWEVMSFKL